MRVSTILILVISVLLIGIALLLFFNRVEIREVSEEKLPESGAVNLPPLPDFSITLPEVIEIPIEIPINIPREPIERIEVAGIRHTLDIREMVFGVTTNIPAYLFIEEDIEVEIVFFNSGKICRLF